MTKIIRTGDVTVRRVTEQETTFLPAVGFIPALTPELLAENRHWMEPTALDSKGGG